MENNLNAELRSENKSNNLKLTSILATISLPFAGFSLFKDEKIFGKIAGSLIGAWLSVGLVYSSVLFQTRNISQVKSEDITISHNYDFNNANSSLDVNDLNFLFLAGSNYYFLKSIINYADNPITKMEVKGKQFNKNLVCNYHIDGFKNLDEIKLEDLHLVNVKMNGSLIRGEFGNKNYDDFCRTIFSKYEK